VRGVATLASLLLAVAVSLWVLAGCGSTAPSPGKSAAVPHTPTAPTAVTPSGDPLALARQAYLGMWRAYVAASRTADYQDPALDHYAAGGALSVLINGLYQEHQEGIVTHGQPTFHPAVKIIEGTPAEAKVTDCANSSRWLDYRSGRPVSGQSLGHRRVTAELELFGTAWKVTYLNVGKEGTC
jgi:hypothetical protein